MRVVLGIALLTMLAGCVKTVYVPQPYMPTPPEQLMQPPTALEPIKPTVEQ